MEGVGLAVGRHVPRRGQSGHDFGAAGLELDQTVINGARAGIEGGAIGVERGLEAVGVALGAVHQGLGGQRGQAEGRKRRAQRECGNGLSHGSFLMGCERLGFKKAARVYSKFCAQEAQILQQPAAIPDEGANYQNGFRIRQSCGLPGEAPSQLAWQHGGWTALRQAVKAAVPKSVTMRDKRFSGARHE